MVMRAPLPTRADTSAADVARGSAPMTAATPPPELSAAARAFLPLARPLVPTLWRACRVRAPPAISTLPVPISASTWGLISAVARDVPTPASAPKFAPLAVALASPSDTAITFTSPEVLIWALAPMRAETAVDSRAVTVVSEPAPRPPATAMARATRLWVLVASTSRPVASSSTPSKAALTLPPAVALELVMPTPTRLPPVTAVPVWAWPLLSAVTLTLPRASMRAVVPMRALTWLARVALTSAPPKPVPRADATAVVSARAKGTRSSTDALTLTLRAETDALSITAFTWLALVADAPAMLIAAASRPPLAASPVMREVRLVIWLAATVRSPPALTPPAGASVRLASTSLRTVLLTLDVVLATVRLIRPARATAVSSARALTLSCDPAWMRMSPPAVRVLPCAWARTVLATVLLASVTFTANAPATKPAPADSDAARCVAEIALAWAAWISMWPDASSTLPASASAATVLLMLLLALPTGTAPPTPTKPTATLTTPLRPSAEMDAFSLARRLTLPLVARSVEPLLVARTVLLILLLVKVAPTPADTPTKPPEIAPAPPPDSARMLDTSVAARARSPDALVSVDWRARAWTRLLMKFLESEPRPEAATPT